MCWKQHFYSLFTHKYLEKYSTDFHQISTSVIGVGAQSTLGGGHKIFARKKCFKNQPEFYMILAPKNYQNTRIFILPEKFAKLPNFCMILCRKMSEFYVIIARKIFSRILGGGARAPCPLSPTPMTSVMHYGTEVKTWNVGVRRLLWLLFYYGFFAVYR